MEHAVVASLSQHGHGIVLLPEHTEARGKTVHDETCSKVVVGGQSSGQIQLELGLDRLFLRPASGEVAIHDGRSGCLSDG
jgi:hypothetical protein